jgi:uncharacterized caspase-like protein
MRHRLILFLSFLLFAFTATPQGFADQTAGVALLIGNAVYPDADSPLPEPVKDARVLADELRSRGFDVTVGENLKKTAMQKALDEFYGKITSNSIAVMFFSGFGIQSDRQNYMIPVDAQIWNESDVHRDGFNLDNILTELTHRGARIKVAIVDASRRNPFERRFRSVSAGLAAVTAVRGTVVMTSASPDTVVETNPPVFMPLLLAALKSSDLTIQQTFNQTRMDVSRQTSGQQVPWFSSSLDADVPLGHPATPAAAVASAATAPAAAPAAPAPVAAPAAPAPVAAPAASAPAAAPAASAPAAAPAAPAPVAAPAAPAPAAVPAAPAPAVVPASPPAAVASAPPAQPASPPATVSAPLAPSSPAPATPASSSEPAAPEVGTKVASADPEAEARHDYVLAEDAGTKQAWDDFVAKHPSGHYYDLAVQQLAKLTPATANTSTTVDDGNNPTDLPGFYRRGQQRAVRGDYVPAIQDFTEVIRRDSKHAGALNDRCWVRALIGELQDALKDCNAALQVAPNYPDALDSRGLVNLKLGLLTTAIADYDAALALDPKHASALYGRGIAKRRSGDAAGSKSDIEAAKAITPTIADEFASYGVK